MSNHLFLELAGFAVTSLNTVLLVLIGVGLFDLRDRVRKIESYYQHNKKAVLHGLSEASEI